MSVRGYVCVSVCVRVYVCVYVHMYACMYVCIRDGTIQATRVLMHHAKSITIYHCLKSIRIFEHFLYH